MPRRPEVHRPRGYRPRPPDPRPSAARRGYGAPWQRTRAAHLREHPLCADCLEEGRVAAAEHVHHVAKVADRPDLLHDPNNLRSLCESHHNRRTARGE